jgi:hypothetical protein
LVPERDRQFSLVRVHHKHRDETYKAGQSFSELPGDRQGVTTNASKMKPHRSVVDLTENLPRKHGRVDEGGLDACGQVAARP